MKKRTLLLMLAALALCSSQQTHAMESFDMPEMQQLLTEYEIELDMVDCAKYGDWQELDALLRRNHSIIDINARHTQSGTLLHIAAKHGHFQVVKVLLSMNAQVDMKNQQGVTPLHMACFFGHQDIAILLCQFGANPDTPTQKGFSAYQLAEQKGNFDLEILLQDCAQLTNKENISPLVITNNAKKQRDLLDDCYDGQTKKIRHTANPLSAKNKRDYDDEADVLSDNRDRKKIKISNDLINNNDDDNDHAEENRIVKKRKKDPK